MKKTRAIKIAAPIAALTAGIAAADFVTIGNPGNVADKNGFGSVGYTYKIGMYEVTAAQMMTARSADSRVCGTNVNYWNDGTRTLGDRAPAGNVSAFEAMRYCNWLTTGDAYTGAYQFDSNGTLTNVMSRAEILATGETYYLLPTEDEWHKAAFFHDGNHWSGYSDGTDTLPLWGAGGWNYFLPGHGYAYYHNGEGSAWAVGSGAQGPNGTYDMLGNLWEWTESPFDQLLDNMLESRSIRGDSYYWTDSELYLDSSYRGDYDPSIDDNPAVGFRMVVIPEPATMGLFFLGSGIAWLARLKQRL